MYTCAYLYMISITKNKYKQDHLIDGLAPHGEYLENIE